MRTRADASSVRCLFEMCRLTSAPWELVRWLPPSRGGETTGPCRWPRANGSSRRWRRCSGPRAGARLHPRRAPPAPPAAAAARGPRRHQAQSGWRCANTALVWCVWQGCADGQGGDEEAGAGTPACTHDARCTPCLPARRVTHPPRSTAARPRRPAPPAPPAPPALAARVAPLAGRGDGGGRAQAAQGQGQGGGGLAWSK